MNKDTLTLKDGAVIELEAGASLSDIRVASENGAAMLGVWGKFTEDNLSEVIIKNGDGLAVGTYSGLVLESETSSVREDGTILTSFNLREKTDVEKRLDAVEQGQRIQDEAIQTHNDAIGDIGQVMSDIVEGGAQ